MMTSAAPLCTAGSVLPLQSHLELAALRTAPGCARGHVRAVAHEWGLSALADDAELLTSELVTNSVQACDRQRGRADLAFVPVVRLWLVSDRLSLVVHVWDSSDEMPIRQSTTSEELGGRGLVLVEALSQDWGAYRKADGKVVWAMIGLSGDR